MAATFHRNAFMLSALQKLSGFLKFHNFYNEFLRQCLIWNLAHIYFLDVRIKTLLTCMYEVFLNKVKVDGQHFIFDLSRLYHITICQAEGECLLALSTTSSRKSISIRQKHPMIPLAIYRDYFSRPDSATSARVPETR